MKVIKRKPQRKEGVVGRWKWGKNEKGEKRDARKYNKENRQKKE